MTVNPIKQVAAAKEVAATASRTTSRSTTAPADFARVAIKHYATGPKEHAYDGWFGWSANDDRSPSSTTPVDPTGCRPGLFEGGTDVSWDSYSTVDASFRSFSQLQDESTYRRVSRPASRSSVARSPRSPTEGPSRAAPGAACALCVTDGVLHGFLSMMTSAGTRQLGFADHGKWQLFSGHQRLQVVDSWSRPTSRASHPEQKLTLWPARRRPTRSTGCPPASPTSGPSPPRTVTAPSRCCAPTTSRRRA